MDTIHTINELRTTLSEVRRAGKRISFVPTMGHLHAAHQDLARRAGELGDFVAASIFVNPIQFGEGEDYSSYPRTLDADQQKLEQAGADLLFNPDVGELYPHGSEGMTLVEVPHLSEILCGVHRPVHFRGVSTVVNILFNIVQPDVAVFGEKDFQQLMVIRRMVTELHMPVEVVGVPTTREDSGLAMSSRNVYLTEEERRIAPELYKLLKATRDAIRAGEQGFPGLESRAMQKLGACGFRPEYVSIRRAYDLEKPREGDREVVVLAAAWLGRARLIDNIVV